MVGLNTSIQEKQFSMLQTPDIQLCPSIEYVVRSFLPSCVFLRCDHFNISLCEDSINQNVLVRSILLLPCVIVYYIVSVFFKLFFWCPCMAINVIVQYNGGLLPDIILLTQCYFHRTTRLYAIRGFVFAVFDPT